MTNSVAIYDEQCRLVAKQQDDAAVALYGLMQQAIKAKSYDDPEGHAQQLLKDGRTAQKNPMPKRAFPRKRKPPSMRPK